MRKLLLIMLLAFLPFSGSQAATIDVYEGEAVVASKDASDRRRALPLALKHTLQKFSGLRSFEDYPLVASALGRASSILVSFYYRNVAVALADGSEVDELRLVAKFSAEKINEMARSLQLPLWPAERDPIDIWVVVDDGLDRRIMPVEFAYVWESMTSTADWRGLPVSWPSADEEGVFQVDAQLLWGGYTEDLGLAPGTGAMIVAARREGLEWSVRSNLAYHDENWTWRIQDLDLQAALTGNLQQAIDFIATANTIAAADMGIWNHELMVADVNSAGDYEACLGYLEKLGVVSQVSVVSARPGGVTFNLELNAAPQYLEEALAGGGVIERNEDEDSYSFLH